MVSADCGHIERDDLVADELVDEPVAVDHDAVRAVEEAVHQPAELRRPHLLREPRRPAHVGEQHRDLDLGAAGMRAHERLAHVAVVRVLRGWTALEDEADHGCRRSAERHEARLAARRAGDAPMSPALTSHHARVARDDRTPELLVVGHAGDRRTMWARRAAQPRLPDTWEEAASARGIPAVVLAQSCKQRTLLGADAHKESGG